MLRRSFATWGKAYGCDVKVLQEQLGHARPDMTVEEYIQPIDAVRIEQITRMELILRGKVPTPAQVRAMVEAQAGRVQ